MGTAPVGAATVAVDTDQELSLTVDSVNGVRSGELNLFLRGWAGYFRSGNSTQAFDKVGSHATNRLSLLVAKRHSRPLRWGWQAAVYQSSDLMGLQAQRDRRCVQADLGAGGASRPST